MGQVKKEELRIIELKNKKDSSLRILNFGATLFSFRIYDKHKNLTECIVGPKRPEDYLSVAYKEDNRCFGATVGRYAGRISKGGFQIDDKEYVINEVEGVHLHGGKSGFQDKLWEVADITTGSDPSVLLEYTSKDGEEGYPGNLKVQAKYTLTENDEILIDYSATTDKDTIINITNHAYWNLNGGGSVSDHFMKINASKVLELEDNNLPTGNLVKLRDSFKDYRESKITGNRPLDDVFVLDTIKGELQAQLFSSLSGIKLRLYSNQDALVVYLPESLPSNWDYLTKLDEQFPAVALEAQNFPDAPHFRNFPSSILKVGENYENNIRLEFSVK